MSQLCSGQEGARTLDPAALTNSRPDCTFWHLSLMSFPNQDRQASGFLSVEKVPKKYPAGVPVEEEAI